MKVWRDMDRPTLDREYNARASVPDFDAELARYRSASAQARATLPHHAGLVYEPARRLALDWFRGAPGGPVLLWIHGGYWRALSKEDQSCVAPGLVAAGIHVAVMDYALAPEATLEEIVDQARAALAWVHAAAEGFGADPARLYAAGSSAGGHLCAMLMLQGWQHDHGLLPGALRGGIALSGLFDLEPIRLSHVNDWLGLDAPRAHALSPLHHLPTPPAPALLASYGGLETGEFKRQTETFAAAWSAAGHRAMVVPQPTRNHFDIAVALGTRHDPLCDAACAFLLEHP